MRKVKLTDAEQLQVYAVWRELNSAHLRARARVADVLTAHGIKPTDKGTLVQEPTGDLVFALPDEATDAAEKPSPA